MADDASDISSLPSLYTVRRLSGKNVKFTARIKNLKNGEMDTIGTSETKEEAQQEYERLMSTCESVNQCLQTPETRTKRHRAAVDVDIDGITNHDGMTDSILKDYLSSSIVDTPTSLKKGLPGSMFDDEVDYENFETPVKVQCPKKKGLTSASSRLYFRLRRSLFFNPTSCDCFGELLDNAQGPAVHDGINCSDATNLGDSLIYRFRRCLARCQEYIIDQRRTVLRH